MKQKALTLIEVIVSLVIFALVFAGLTGVLVSGKRHIQHSRSRISAGELGKIFLDPLQNDVNAGTWGANRLSNPDNAVPIDVTLDNRLYTGSYVIGNNAPLANLNRVRANIHWDE